MDDKILSNKEVDEVSGGSFESRRVVPCPYCKSVNTQLQGSTFNRITLTRNYEYICMECGEHFEVVR